MYSRVDDLQQNEDLKKRNHEEMKSIFQDEFIYLKWALCLLVIIIILLSDIFITISVVFSYTSKRSGDSY